MKSLSNGLLSALAASETRLNSAAIFPQRTGGIWPHGSTTLPGGGTITTADGTAIAVPRGTTVPADGRSIELPRGHNAATITDKNGSATAAEPGYTIKLNGGGQVTGTTFNNPFQDVHPGDWFYDDVMYCYTHGLLDGAGAFNPGDPMSRGMAVTILWHMAGQPSASGGNPFADVADGDSCAKAAAWARSMGIVNGVGGNLFAPGASITRQDLIVLMYNFAKAMGRPLPATRGGGRFLDETDTASYAKDAIGAFFRAGLVSGKPGNAPDPKHDATNAEIAAILHRFFELFRR